jgi:hypothetical protein
MEESIIMYEKFNEILGSLKEPKLIELKEDKG